MRISVLINKNDSSFSTDYIAQALQMVPHNSSMKDAGQGLACDKGGFWGLWKESDLSKN